MRSVNKVILVWNVTRDPQTKSASSGHDFSTFTVATNREWFTPDWKKQSLAEFHRVAAWWKLAELCWKYLKKWKLIYIEGYLKTRIWEDENGQKQHKTEIIAQDMIMLNKRDDLDDSMEDFSGDNWPSIDDLNDTPSSSSVDLDWDHI